MLKENDMKIKLFIMLAVIFASTPSYAGPIYDVFGEGVFGLKWGASLEEVKKSFPEGKTTTEKLYATYEIKDGRQLFGIDRLDSNYMVFTFNEQGELGGVKIQFPNEGLIGFTDLLTALNVKFGVAPFDFGKAQMMAIIPILAWPIDNGMMMSIFNNSTIKTTLFSAEVEYDLSFLISKKPKPTATNANELGF
jgi:hypothetical protein